ncbi:OB-fold nucleic acid binding domain-containing protein [Candidatus Micrarchaeota archaeon]|nr:OB-fold nucleic acid binding domain-containing protein [Candidatus Micrarchaeota archaeon]
MSERHYVYLSLGLAFVGILLLVVFLKSSGPTEKKLNEISEEDIGRMLLVKGRVSGIYSKNGNTFFKLCEYPRCVQVAIFSSLAKRMREGSINPAGIKNGGLVEVKGVLKEYGGELELVPLDIDSVNVLK